jgi:hypothetical protein
LGPTPLHRLSFLRSVPVPSRESLPAAAGPPGC